MTAQESVVARVPALELRDVSKVFHLKSGGILNRKTTEVRAVRDVNLVLERNSIMGLVGESGSGKTTTGMMALRLTEPTEGNILLQGTDITTLDVHALKPIRRRMQVVFQDSYSALDPMFTLQQIVAEPMVIHGVGTAQERKQRALDWLERVGLHRSFGNRYPHELSGGQRQRVAIARALILEPAVLIADEPTSALDVSVKAQIINLLQDLQTEMELSVLFISHDLSVVRSLTDKVAVMFNGRIVEEAPTEAIFASPRHPYTRSLLDAIPVLNPRARPTRVFRTREELEEDTVTLRASDLAGSVMASDARRLVDLGAGHRVEARVVA
ncbi:MAG: ATP-binding cassette domain-containing protein [Pseudomonadota bacterium]